MTARSRRPSEPGSPLRGRYLVQQPVANLVLRGIDAILSHLPRAADSVPRGAPRRVLLAIGGHLGDAVIATAAVGMLRRCRPDVEIGVLAPSWARPVLGGHPAIRWLHHVDHWKLNRQRDSRLQGWRHHGETARRARREIAAVGYDAAVDLYPYFPNSAVLLRRAGIPLRIGYVSGGFGPLYTHAVPWENRPGDWHTVEQHRRLLLELPGMPSDAATLPLRYDMPAITPAAAADAERILADQGVGEGGYVVVHPGAGDPRKEWPVGKWRAMVGALSERGLRMVFTGAGASQARSVEAIMNGIPHCTSLVGRLPWDTFRAVIAGARMLAGVDTVAPHLAAAAGVPVVVLSAGMSDVAHWRPYGERCSVLQAPVPCAPCHRGDGCGTMDCLTGVTPAQVERAILHTLGLPVPEPLVSIER